MYWQEVHKGDQRARVLADKHYTRQSVGHPMFTRPGFNQVLYYEQRNGRAAVWVWWRPKWESGLIGTERKDKLRAIECTLFRNETRVRSLTLIREAVTLGLLWEHARDVAWPDGFITGVSSVKTSGGRSEKSKAGHCYREAGWVEFSHPGKSRIADVWLRTLSVWDRIRDSVTDES